MHNPKWDDLRAGTGSILHIPNKIVIEKHVNAIIERLNSVDNENLDDTEIMPSESSMQQQSDNQTHKGKLQEEIEKSMLIVES